MSIFFFYLEFGPLSSMAVISLHLFNLFSDKKIKYAIAVGASETALVYKRFIGRAAGGTCNLLSVLLLGGSSLQPQKAGQQPAQRKFSVKNSGVLAEIQFLRTLGAQIMLCLYPVNHFCIFDIRLSDFTSLT